MPTRLARLLHTVTGLRRKCHDSTKRRCTTFPYRSVPAEMQCSFFNKMAVHHISIHVCACRDAMFILQQDGGAPRFSIGPCLLRCNVHSSTRWRCTTFPYRSVPAGMQCSFFNKMAVHHISIQVCACRDAMFILQQDGGAPRFPIGPCLLRCNVHSSKRRRCTTFPHRSLSDKTQCSLAI